MVRPFCIDPSMELNLTRSLTLFASRIEAGFTFWARFESAMQPHVLSGVFANLFFQFSVACRGVRHFIPSWKIVEGFSD